MVARERLDCQMDTLMSLEVMVSIERLWANVASEWTIVLRLVLLVAIYLSSHVVRWILLHVDPADK